MGAAELPVALGQIGGPGPGEGQGQDVPRVHPEGPDHVGQPADDHRGLAAPRHRQQQRLPLGAGDGFKLLVPKGQGLRNPAVFQKPVHLFDSTHAAASFLNLQNHCLRKYFNIKKSFYQGGPQ